MRSVGSLIYVPRAGFPRAWSYVKQRLPCTFPPAFRRTFPLHSVISNPVRSPMYFRWVPPAFTIYSLWVPRAFGRLFITPCVHYFLVRSPTRFRCASDALAVHSLAFSVYFFMPPPVCFALPNQVRYPMGTLNNSLTRLFVLYPVRSLSSPSCICPCIPPSVALHFTVVSPLRLLVYPRLSFPVQALAFAIHLARMQTFTLYATRRISG